MLGRSDCQSSAGLTNIQSVNYLVRIDSFIKLFVPADLAPCPVDEATNDWKEVNLIFPSAGVIIL